jgi:Flp pilus assembly pilin Flp
LKEIHVNYRRSSDSRGGALVEYVLLVGLIALVAHAAFVDFGESVNEKVSEQASCVDGGDSCGGGADQARTGALALWDDDARRDRLDAAVAALEDKAGTPDGNFAKKVAATAVSFLKGVLIDGLWGTVTGVWGVVTDPIETGKAIGNALAHPIQTATVIKRSVVAAWEDDPVRLIGAGIFEVVTAPIAAAKATKLTRAAKVANKAEGASDASKAAAAVRQARNGALGDPARQGLLDELAKSGVKHDPTAVERIGKTPDGKLVFLEQGKGKMDSPKPSGLEHILEDHGDDFQRAGIPRDQVPDAVMAAVTNGKVVGYQGKGTGRPIYEVTIDGQTHRVAVTTGNNGYIVGANPAGRLP